MGLGSTGPNFSHPQIMKRLEYVYLENQSVLIKVPGILFIVTEKDSKKQ